MALKEYVNALVTGASSGIGEATVTALREKGLTVHAIARRQDRLEALKERTGCETHILDVCDRDAVYQILGGLEADILINNAGVGRRFGQDFTEVSPDDIDLMLQTNVIAAMHAVRAVTSGMKARSRGHVVNIGSVGGLYPVSSSIYGASKGAIHLMNQNLRLELAGTAIRVTEICPGRVGTEFFDNAIDDEEARKNFNSGFDILQPRDIADAIVYALDAPWRVNVSMIELTPTEQVLGGGRIVRAKGRQAE